MKSACVLVLLLVAPCGASASIRLLDEELRGPGPASVPASPGDGRQVGPSTLVVALAAPRAYAAGGGDAAPAPSSTQGESPQQPPGSMRPAPKPDSLDFDLLGAPPKPPPVDEGALRLRRKMLTWHQGVGLGMFALQLATTVVGQLNYDDKFGGDNTAKYVQPHAILAYSTLAAFAAAGALALLAPKPFERHEGFDRVSLHKWSMLVATAGMVTQGVLGIWTGSREGYLNQQGIATAHLVVGYVTLVAVATGVSALVF